MYLPTCHHSDTLNKYSRKEKETEKEFPISRAKSGAVLSPGNRFITVGGCHRAQPLTQREKKKTLSHKNALLL